MNPTIQLAPAQVEFFKTHGYLSLDVITSAAEIARMRGIYDRLFANRTGRETGNQFDLAGADEEGVEAKLPQILGPSRYEPELKDSLYMANALAIAKQLLGEEATFQGDHAILKPARSPAATPWHQDEAYWGSDWE
ncbi:MAG: phytanoyl-CoA dioxygenase family protein, partial [Planctomycetota bacterium]|nr:phytanoyl-CoA dioxygenase family protein [Planctomycetota bacterium]